MIAPSPCNVSISDFTIDMGKAPTAKTTSGFSSTTESHAALKDSGVKSEVTTELSQPRASAAVCAASLYRPQTGTEQLTMASFLSAGGRLLSGLMVMSGVAFSNPASIVEASL